MHVDGGGKDERLENQLGNSYRYFGVGHKGQGHLNQSFLNLFLATEALPGSKQTSLQEGKAKVFWWKFGVAIFSLLSLSWDKIELSTALLLDSVGHR